MSGGAMGHYASELGLMDDRPEPPGDSLADAERLRVDVLNTPASKRERELGAALERLINEVKELREENRELDEDRSFVPLDTRDKIDALHTRIKQMEEALRYVARPTMGLPPGREPVEFVDAVPEHIVRLVLKTCIRIATAALNPSDTG